MSKAFFFNKTVKVHFTELQALDSVLTSMVFNVHVLQIPR
jgi:hypothetical protein